MYQLSVFLLVAVASLAAVEGSVPPVDSRYECAHAMNIPTSAIQNSYVLNGGCQVQCTGYNRNLLATIREGLPCTDQRGYQSMCRGGQCGTNSGVPSYPNPPAGPTYPNPPVYPPSQPAYPPVYPQQNQVGSLDITVQRGKVPQMKAFYQKGNSNTYVNVYLNSTSHRIGASPVVRDSLKPEYNYRLTASRVYRNTNVIFSVMESRKNSKDDFIGSAILNVDQLVQMNRNGVSQRYYIPHKDGNSKYYLEILASFF